MEGLMMHGAAHVYFEGKLDDLTSEFNAKIKKMDMFVRKELQKLHTLHRGEMKKLKAEIKVLKTEVEEIRKSEDDISSTGFDKIRKLSKEVKEEVNEIKKIKGEVMHLKEEITEIKHHEDDITHVGRQQLTKINKEMKTEVKNLKNHIKCLKRDVMAAKDTCNKPKNGTKDKTDLRIQTLKMNHEEVEQIYAVREALHAAYTSVKDTSEDNNNKNNLLNLWLPSFAPPSVTNDDAIQLSQSVILYVKSAAASPSSSNLASLHWSSQEDVEHSDHMTSNSSFDQCHIRRSSFKKVGSEDTTDEDDNRTRPNHHNSQNIPHPPHTILHSHHHNLSDQGDPVSLSPVPSHDEDEDDDSENEEKNNDEKNNEDSPAQRDTTDNGLTLKIDSISETTLVLKKAT